MSCLPLISSTSDGLRNSVTCPHAVHTFVREAWTISLFPNRYPDFAPDGFRAKLRMLLPTVGTSTMTSSDPHSRHFRSMSLSCITKFSVRLLKECAAASSCRPKHARYKAQRRRRLVTQGPPLRSPDEALRDPVGSGLPRKAQAAGVRVVRPVNATTAAWSMMGAGTASGSRRSGSARGDDARMCAHPASSGRYLAFSSSRVAS